MVGIAVFFEAMDIGVFHSKKGQLAMEAKVQGGTGDGVILVGGL